MRKEMNVNDGKGLWDNVGIVDTLIVDCNNLVKKLSNGEYVSFCAVIVGMVQKLSNLREGIKTEKQSMQDQLDDCQRIIDDLLNQTNQNKGSDD